MVEKLTPKLALSRAIFRAAEKQKSQHFHRKIPKVKEEINRKSEGRWKSRYQKQLAKSKQLVLLGSITFYTSSRGAVI